MMKRLLDRYRTRRVRAVLSALRAIHPSVESLGLNGGCFHVYLFLKELFPDAEPWYDGDHVITKIAGSFWDIRGEVFPGRHLPMRDDPAQYNQAYLWNKRL